MAGHRGVHGSAEEVGGAAGLNGTPIELLLRDQKAVAQEGQGTVVLRRWLLRALARAGIGWATCWPYRDRVPEFGGRLGSHQPQLCRPLREVQQHAFLLTRGKLLPNTTVDAPVRTTTGSPALAETPRLQRLIGRQTIPPFADGPLAFSACSTHCR